MFIVVVISSMMLASLQVRYGMIVSLFVTVVVIVVIVIDV